MTTFLQPGRHKNSDGVDSPFNPVGITQIMGNKRILPVELANQVLKDSGVLPKTHGVAIGAKLQIDRSGPARQARRQEYNGLKSLPFLSEEQVKQLKWLEREVVEDNHVAFREDQKNR